MGSRLKRNVGADPWLENWLDLVAGRAADDPILELGCGDGRDTEVFVAAGHRVVALDISPSQIDAARWRAPAAEFFCQDVRDPFPSAAAGARVVVASLSLHYFPWHETVALFDRIHTLLLPAGLLLCRLNSTNDVHHWPDDPQQIEKDSYLVSTRTKRFFDRTAVEALVAEGWRTLETREQVIDRYGRPKAVWEIVAESVA